jgi:hypothetical protein
VHGAAVGWADRVRRTGPSTDYVGGVGRPGHCPTGRPAALRLARRYPG